MTATKQLIDHLAAYLDSKTHPSQQVVVYLDSLHPTDDDRTLEDLIREAHAEQADVHTNDHSNLGG